MAEVFTIDTIPPEYRELCRQDMDEVMKEVFEYMKKIIKEKEFGDSLFGGKE